MKNKNIYYYIVLVVSTVLFIYHTNKIIYLLIDRASDVYINFSLIYSNIGIFGLFFYLLNSKKNKIKLSNKKVFQLLVIITVLYLSVEHYNILKIGFLSGNHLYWQIVSVILSFLTLYFLIDLMKKIDKKNEA